MKVIAVEFIVQPSGAATFEAAMQQHAKNSRSEPGCKGFDVVRDPEQPGRYLLWESYVDDAAIAFHREQASIKVVGEAIKDIVIERNLTVGDAVS